LSPEISVQEHGKKVEQLNKRSIGSISLFLFPDFKGPTLKPCPECAADINKVLDRNLFAKYVKESSNLDLKPDYTVHSGVKSLILSKNNLVDNITRKSIIDKLKKNKTKIKIG